MTLETELFAEMLEAFENGLSQEDFETKERRYERYTETRNEPV